MDNIELDTVSNMISDIVNRTYKEIHLNNGDSYINVIKIDTIGEVQTMDLISQDTTYQTGIIGNDMVWHNSTFNTVDQVHGDLIYEFSNGEVPTSISIDKNHGANRLIVTVGGFGSHNKVYYTDEATTILDGGNWYEIDGNLPDMPVYSSLISDTVPEGNQDLVILGTEYGIYSTSQIKKDGTTEWIRETALPMVPVFDLVQQQQPNGYLPGVCMTGVENSGAIYAGTHGLGVWKMDLYKREFTGIEEIQEQLPDALQVKVYPNPVKGIANIEYTITETSDVQITVYSLTGKLVYEKNIPNQFKGTYTHKINSEHLSKGVYVISLMSNDERKVSKFIVE
jgi:hypothetical protein